MRDLGTDDAAANSNKLTHTPTHTLTHTQTNDNAMHTNIQSNTHRHTQKHRHTHVLFMWAPLRNLGADDPDKCSDTLMHIKTHIYTNKNTQTQTQTHSLTQTLKTTITHTYTNTLLLLIGATVWNLGADDADIYSNLKNVWNRCIYV